MILRLCNIAVLFVWALFLAWLLTFGKNDLVRLLHPRLWWVLGVALIVLIFFSISLIVQHVHADSRKTVLSELPGIVILLVPLLFFLPTVNARLDGTSLHNRIIQDDGSFYLNNLPSLSSGVDSDSPDMLFSRILREPKEYENQEVEVVCQSFVHDQLPENNAMCFRYMITCCAADALPAFIFLRHDQDMEIENNRWVKVSGALSVIAKEGMEFPSVQIDAIEYVEEPSFPWAL